MNIKTFGFVCLRERRSLYCIKYCVFSVTFSLALYVPVATSENMLCCFTYIKWICQSESLEHEWICLEKSSYASVCEASGSLHSHFVYFRLYMTAPVVKTQCHASACREWVMLFPVAQPFTITVEKCCQQMFCVTIINMQIIQSKELFFFLIPPRVLGIKENVSTVEELTKRRWPWNMPQ